MGEFASLSSDVRCAGGSTVFTPMVEFGVLPWMRTAVIGIGGLGHLAVQFLAKFGCEVTAISSSHDKDQDARSLGADRGCAVGNPSDAARMLEFAARAGIAARVEQFPMAEVNRALDHVRSGAARFRAVLVA